MRAMGGLKLSLGENYGTQKRFTQTPLNAEYDAGKAPTRFEILFFCRSALSLKPNELNLAPHSGKT